MIKQIGLTGGIGSGKSTVARIFESMGYAIYYADARAKALMTEDSELISGVKALLGQESYSPEGQLNRAFVGKEVFGDDDKLQALNALVHPAVARDYHRWISALAEQGYDKSFALKEAAILYESGSYKDSDAVIAVYAPKTVRLERVMARDGVDEAAVLARMEKQWPESKKLERADIVIYNDGEHMLIPQVMAVVEQLK